MITSATGVGTTVKMFLTPSKGRVSTVTTKKTSNMRAGRKVENILLVENKVDVRAAVADQLQKLGYSVQTAANMPEAIEILRAKGEVNLLLSDIILDGDKTGVALAKQARSADKDLKIILMSGYVDPLLSAEIANFADLGWLAKPFDRSALDGELRKLLD